MNSKSVPQKHILKLGLAFTLQPRKPNGVADLIPET